MPAGPAAPASPVAPAAPLRVLPWLAVVLAVALAYANSFSGALVLDDQSSIANNPTLRQLWPLWPVLSPPAGSGVGGRPLANLSLALNFAVSGRASGATTRSTSPFTPPPRSSSSAWCGAPCATQPAGCSPDGRTRWR